MLNDAVYISFTNSEFPDYLYGRVRARGRQKYSKGRETLPLFLQQGLRVFSVLRSPALQLVLHGIHVLLDVVHDLG